MVHEIEGEHGEFLLPVRCHGRLQATEISMAFACGEDELTVDDRGLAREAHQHLRKARQALGPVVAAPAMELYLAAVLDDLEAVAVELRLCSQASPCGMALVVVGMQGRMNLTELGTRQPYVFSVFAASTDT